MKRLLPKSLVARVAWATCAAIAISATCVACVSIVLNDGFARERDERSISDAAGTLATELLEAGADPLHIAVDETRELEHTGIRVAIYAANGFVAGDRGVPNPGAGRCASTPPLRSCGVPAGRLVAVAARDLSHLREGRRTVLAASVLAVVITSLLGAMVARRVALAIVAPLSRLSDAVERVPDDVPSEVDLGVDEGVSEVDALRATLHATLVRLGQALATSRRFASDAAHELRTPLTTVIGELALFADTLEGDALDANARARRTAQRLATLVDRLLVLATPASKLGVSERLDIHDVIDDAVDMLPLALWPRLDVQITRVGAVHGDRALLASMVANALENGLKFSEDTVTVTIGGGETHVELEIRDLGQGIPEAERESVFAPFFRRRATRASGVPGHGIGLSLIAHVVAIHGGHAQFRDCEVGACLVIVLPRAG
ncbi:MAG: HAMP domain-containing histidine kinase [Myxococcales bacterium]|nr:HAMP domain-containing histidine kinase [Myxococcales bacterium]